MSKPYCLNPIRWAFKTAGVETVYNELVVPHFKLTRARVLLGGVFASNVGLIGASVFMNNLVGRVYDTIPSITPADFGRFGIAYGLYAATCLGLERLHVHSSQLLQLHWRDWSRTKMVSTLCSQDRRGGFVNLANGEKMQTGQRVTEDVSNMVGCSASLAVDGLRNLTNAAAFSIATYAIHPGICAAIVGTSLVGISYFVSKGSQIQKLDNKITETTTDLRNAIDYTASNKQKSELWRGEEAEAKGLLNKQKVQTAAVERRIRLGITLATWSSMVGSACRLAPFAVGIYNILMPGSLFTTGKLAEANGAASNLTSSTMWVQNVVPTANFWAMTCKRLAKFITASSASLPAENVPSYKQGGDPSIHIEQLSLGIKDRAKLCKPFDLALKAGDRIALTGKSGCGKTTLLRQLAGVVPMMEGSITYTGLKSPNEALFVPQDPYLPDLSFQEILSYPRAGVVFTKEKMSAVLKDVGLSKFEKYLNDEEMKGSKLADEMSGGEKQRLNFARLLLHEPKVIGLDEATSSLPKEDGLAMYSLLTERLPKCIIISTVHRGELLQHHTLEGVIRNKEWELLPIRKQESVSKLAPASSLAAG